MLATPGRTAGAKRTVMPLRCTRPTKRGPRVAGARRSVPRSATSPPGHAALCPGHTDPLIRQNRASRRGVAAQPNCSPLPRRETNPISTPRGAKRTQFRPHPRRETNPISPRSHAPRGNASADAPSPLNFRIGTTQSVGRWHSHAERGNEGSPPGAKRTQFRPHRRRETNPIPPHPRRETNPIPAGGGGGDQRLPQAPAPPAGTGRPGTPRS